MKININTDAAVEYTNKLEKLHRSALPNAVRGTLNKAAFDVKQRTMPESAGKEFVNRQPNFFKANSRVEMAKGWKIDQMNSTVGFIDNKLKGGNNHAIDDLQQQERGGTIKSRSFIPTDAARGGSKTRTVRPVNRLAGINKIVNSNKGTGTMKENFLTAVRLAGPGGFVIGNRTKKILWRIESIIETGGRIHVKKKAIYSFKDGRSVQVKATGFMRNASMKSAKDIEKFYVAEAKRQIERLLK